MVTTRVPRTPMVPPLPTDCPNCGDPWTVGKTFCTSCGFNPQQNAAIEEMLESQRLQANELQRLTNQMQTPRRHWANLANYGLVPENPEWSPQKRGLLVTLGIVVIAFVLSIIASFVAIALNLDTVVFFTPLGDILVPTGAGIVMFGIVIIIGLFINAKK